MADSNIKVQGPVEVDSKYRVAFDLMEKIASYDETGAERNREYWLTLYAQSLLSIRGHDAKSILKAK